VRNDFRLPAAGGGTGAVGHGRDGAEQAVRFVVGSGREEERGGGTGLGAVAKAPPAA